MARRKKTDWLDDALGHIVGQAARGIGKRLRKALSEPRAVPQRSRGEVGSASGPVAPAPKLAAQGPYQDATKPVVAPTINVFQGPTQVNVQRRSQRSEVRGQKKGRAPRRQKVIDADFTIKKEKP